MNKKRINLLYICLVLMACGCILLFFFAWNSISIVKNHLQGGQLEHFCVDVCEINKHKIYIAGWSYVPNQDHSITKVYAEIEGGDLLPIAGNSVVREDVSKIFGESKYYRYAGFQASKRLIRKENLTNKIFVVTQTENNQSYVAQHICK